MPKKNPVEAARKAVLKITKKIADAHEKLEAENLTGKRFEALLEKLYQAAGELPDLLQKLKDAVEAVEE